MAYPKGAESADQALFAGAEIAKQNGHSLGPMKTDLENYATSRYAVCDRCGAMLLIQKDQAGGWFRGGNTQRMKCQSVVKKVARAKALRNARKKGQWLN